MRRPGHMKGPRRLTLTKHTTLFTYVGKKLGVNQIPVLEPCKHQGYENCFVFHTSNSANCDAKLLWDNINEDFPYILKPLKGYQLTEVTVEHSVKILDHARIVGIPTRWSHRGGNYLERNLQPNPLYKIKGSKMISLPRSKQLIKHLKKTAPFMIGFVGRSTYNRDKAGKKAYRGGGIGRAKNEGHVVTVVGVGRETVWYKVGPARWRKKNNGLYWSYQNSRGPCWGIGKLGCQVVLHAWLLYV